MKLNQEFLPNTEGWLFQSSRHRCHPNSHRYFVRRMANTEGDGKDMVDMYAEFEMLGWHRLWWLGGVMQGQSVRESRSQMKEFSLTPSVAESFRDTHSEFPRRFMWKLHILSLKKVSYLKT